MKKLYFLRLLNKSSCRQRPGSHVVIDSDVHLEDGLNVMNGLQVGRFSL